MGEEGWCAGRKKLRKMRTSHRGQRQRAAAHSPRKINLSVSVSLCVSSPSLDLPLPLTRSLGSPLGVAPWRSSRTPFLARGTPSSSSWLSHLHYTSGRIYWPQNTMRTCPCPSTETGSRPLVVYLFAVAIHIRPLRHIAARERRRRKRRERKKQREREYGTGLFKYFAPGRVKVARECYSREESRETDGDCLKRRELNLRNSLYDL